MKVTEIMQAYPDAMSPQNRSANMAPGSSYCVGGALCKYLGRNNRWPMSSHLAEALMEANPRLTESKARDHAKRIMAANDTLQDIPLAWNFLHDALQEK